MPPFSRRRLFHYGAAASIVPFASRIGAQEKPARPDPYADAVLVPGEPPLPEKGSFTIVVLPDTQNYSERHPATFEAQTRWIIEQKEKRNIACVLHLGDITNQNTPEQWANAVKAMRLLDGKVPYFMVPGNHDYGQKGNGGDRTCGFSEHFPVAHWRQQPGFGAVYDKEPDRAENCYHFFEAGGRKFLVLCLEFGPRRDVVRWANEVVAKFPGHGVILITHAYMYDDDTRYDWAKYQGKQEWNPHAYGMAKASGGDVMDGEELWRELVSRHGNFLFTMNGHVLHDGLGRLSSDATGRQVHQMLVNFQMRPKGGDGWLRLMEVKPDGAMRICDYSPMRGERNESLQNYFELQLAPLRGD